MEPCYVCIYYSTLPFTFKSTHQIPSIHHYFLRRGGRGGRGGGRGRGGRGGYSEDLFDGPTPILNTSENRWMPVKDANTIAVTEKKVKSILNKMTKEKFEKLANQMIEIPITSFEVLTTMIHSVYEKAIFEPSFGEIYADLCARLSDKAKQNPFVKMIESDEEPPTENGGAQGGEGTSSSHNTVYRWSNDVSTDDSEIIGPFKSVEECIDAALDADNCPEPTKRCNEMVLHTVRIRGGKFIKIMCPVENPEEFYTVFFPVSKAKEIGQQISNIFLSEIECHKDGSKKNSFKVILLNKCQDEFTKKDIYDAWRIEKKGYDEQKGSFSDSERRVKEEDLEFRRIKTKKQMLGNIRFIGELFKIGMLKVKVMRDCIENLLKLQQDKDADGNLTGNIIDLDDIDMDEEDHEAVQKLFITIGSTIDQGKYRDVIDVYFFKIEGFSDDMSLNSRTRFLYKDLIDLRRNRWVARREEETAKTLDEIKKDFEREERIQQQETQNNQGYRGGGGGRGRGSQGRGGGRGGGGDYRTDDRDNRRSSYDVSSTSRSRAPKERVEPKIDRDGFTEVAGGKAGITTSRYGSGPSLLSRDSKNNNSSRDNKQSRPATGLSQQSAREPSPTPQKPEPLSDEKLKIRAKNMMTEYMQEENEKELILSMDDLKFTPNAGKVIVQASVDMAIDCKEAEREAIISVISILYRNGKLTSEDIGTPFADIIEFIDSFVVDSPRAMEYMGDLMAEFLHIKALDVKWLCEQAKKLEEFSAHLIPRVFAACVNSVVTRHSVDEAKAHFGQSTDTLISLLSAERWEEISAKSGLK